MWKGDSHFPKVIVRVAEGGWTGKRRDKKWL